MIPFSWLTALTRWWKPRSGRRQRASFHAVRNASALESRQYLSATVGVISEARDGSGALIGSLATVGGNSAFEEFQIQGRWSATATNGSGLVQGDPTTVT